MINSRDLKELLPHVREKAEQMIAECKAQGIDLIVTSTYRDYEAQNALYAIGRGQPGKRVTNAKGGDSFHNHRCAFDVVPLVGGKASWDDMGLWQKVGAIGQKVGLEWGGTWLKFRDIPHFQCSLGKSISEWKLAHEEKDKANNKNV